MDVWGGWGPGVGEVAEVAHREPTRVVFSVEK